MRPIKGYEFRNAVESSVAKFGKSILNKDDMRVVWTDRTNEASIISSYASINLPNIADDAVISHQYVDNYIGWLFHEILHVRYSSQTFKSPSGTYVQALFEGIEDAYIERKAIDHKVVGNAEGFLRDQANGLVDETMMDVQDWTDPANYPFALAMYARGFCNVPPLAGGLESIFAEATERIKASKGSEDNLKIAEWVFQQLQLPPESNPPPPPPQAKGEGEGEEGEGQEGEGEDDGEGEGKPKPIQTVGTRKIPSRGQKTKPASVKPKKLEKSMHTGGTYSKDAFLTDKSTHMRCNPGFKTDTVGSAKLRYEVRKLFEMSGLDEWQINRKNGALNPNALHRVSTGNSKVFKRHLEEDGIDSAVVIVLDVSGSMFGDDLMQDAVRTCVTLLDTLNRAGVATALLTFGQGTALFKPFSMPVKKVIPDLARVDDGGGTNDYFAIRYAHELLLHRRERRKICFAITDGQGDVDETSAQVETGERLGITTIGIGIGCDVSGTYPKSVRVKNSRDLANTSFKHIKLAA